MEYFAGLPFKSVSIGVGRLELWAAKLFGTRFEHEGWVLYCWLNTIYVTEAPDGSVEE